MHHHTHPHGAYYQQVVKAVCRQVGFDPDESLLELLAKGCKEG